MIFINHSSKFNNSILIKKKIYWENSQLSLIFGLYEK